MNSTLQNLLQVKMKYLQLIIGEGADLNLVLEDALDYNDYVTLQNLIIFDPGYLDITNIFEQLIGINQ